MNTYYKNKKKLRYTLNKNINIVDLLILKFKNILMCFESFLVRLPFQKFQISPKLITYFLKHILEKIFFDEVVDEFFLMKSFLV